MSDEFESELRRLPPFAAFLERRFHELAMKYPGRIDFSSRVKFGEWLGIKQSTFSTWMNGSKTPSDQKVIDQIAAKLGIETYKALGIAPRVPNNKKALLALEILERLTPANAEKFLDYGKKLAEDGDGDSQYKSPQIG